MDRDYDSPGGTMQGGMKMSPRVVGPLTNPGTLSKPVSVIVCEVSTAAERILAMAERIEGRLLGWPDGGVKECKPEEEIPPIQASLLETNGKMARAENILERILETLA